MRVLAKRFMLLLLSIRINGSIPYGATLYYDTSDEANLTKYMFMSHTY
jgi:hypothetical protein